MFSEPARVYRPELTRLFQKNLRRYAGLRGQIQRHVDEFFLPSALTNGPTPCARSRWSTPPTGVGMRPDAARSVDDPPPLVVETLWQEP